MTYDLTLEARAINLMPTTEAEEILQNVRMILTTAAGTVGLYREFGLDASLVDMPVNVARNKFVAEVAKAIARWEPRCRLKKITWQTSQASDGMLAPRVTIEIQ